jgi:DNA-binding GntR family transcriptional regulator
MTTVQGGPFGGHRVRATTLREEVFRALRRAILAGQLAPGARLQETELAASLGVSRNPVREALSRLEAQGLVRSVPNQGARVISPLPAQVQDALLVRAQLELLAVRLALRKARLCQFDALAGIVAQMQVLAADSRALPPEQSLPLKSDGAPSFRDAGVHGRMNLLDTAFHEGLVASAESDSLQHTWNAAAPLDLIFVHNMAASPAYADRSALADAEKHARLLAALRSCHATCAEAALREHFVAEPSEGMVSLDAASAAILGW